MRRRHLLVLSGLCAACSPGLGGGAATSQAPSALLGEFQDDYGIQYAIADTLWHQKPNSRYRIVHWDSAGQFLIAQNDAENPSDPGKWTRIDWLTLEGMPPYAWAFCLTAYDADSREAAEATEPADRTTPRTGCDGFPFSRMERAASSSGIG